MPELPEVETIRRELARKITNKKIVNFKISKPTLVKEPSVAGFKKGLIGEKVKAVIRKAKLLIIKLKEDRMAESDLIHSDITREIIGAAMEVHSTLGAGFLEAVYEEALTVELAARKVAFEKQKPIRVIYKGIEIKEYICDLMVDGKVLVELKAIKELTAVEEAQLLNYLKATDTKVGLLINFGSSSLCYKRLVN